MSQSLEVDLSLPLTDRERLQSQPRCAAVTWQGTQCKAHGSLFGLCATHYRKQKRFKQKRMFHGARD